MAAISKPKLWLMERFLGSEEAIRRPFREVDWPNAIRQYQTPDFEYPAYYRRDFHGVPGGYLQPDAAVTYDPVTARIVLPNEPKIRKAFVKRVKEVLGENEPQKILDLGVGTGTAALDWAQTFPQAELVGIDLSPYMLVAASLKLKGQKVELRQARAEATGFADHSFDMVTASFLFHEIPQEIARQVVAEAQRLLRPGGIFAVYDGNQRSNFLVKTVGGYFPEPYIKEYMTSDLPQMCRESGFAAVEVKRYLMFHQFVTAFRTSF